MGSHVRCAVSAVVHPVKGNKRAGRVARAAGMQLHGLLRMQVRCEVAATPHKLAAMSYLFVAIHLWLQGGSPLSIALDMAAALAVTLWLYPAAAALVEVWR